MAALHWSQQAVEQDMKVPWEGLQLDREEKSDFSKFASAPSSVTRFPKWFFVQASGNTCLCCFVWHLVSTSAKAIQQGKWWKNVRDLPFTQQQELRDRCEALQQQGLWRVEGKKEGFRKFILRHRWDIRPHSSPCEKLSCHYFHCTSREA